jgi:hypothetical protein
MEIDPAGVCSICSDSVRDDDSMGTELSLADPATRTACDEQ